MCCDRVNVIAPERRRKRQGSAIETTKRDENVFKWMQKGEKIAPQLKLSVIKSNHTRELSEVLTNVKGQ